MQLGPCLPMMEAGTGGAGEREMSYASIAADPSAQTWVRAIAHDLSRGDRDPVDVICGLEALLHTAHVRNDQIHVRYCTDLDCVQPGH